MSVDFSQITFGGGLLEREAHLRGRADEMERLTADPMSRTILLWKGRPLVAGAGRDRLALLPLDHPVLADTEAEQVFLGFSNGVALLARNLSNWQPEGDQPDSRTFFDPGEYGHPDLPADHCFAELRAVMTRLSPLEAELAATAKALFGWHASHRFCSSCGSPSEIIQSGWQRKCPDCGAMHFPRNDPVVIMLITYGNEVLLGRSPGWPEGMYSLLAGFMEPGEGIEAAVRREVLEETGVRVGPVRLLGSQPWPYPNSLMIGCAGEAATKDIELDPIELEDALWISREEMVQVAAGLHPKIKPGRRGSIAHFIMSNWLADRLF